MVLVSSFYHHREEMSLSFWFPFGICSFIVKMTKRRFNYVCMTIMGLDTLICSLDLDEKPPLLSAAFMELTGFGTAVMTRYLRYQCIIACMFMDELDDVINSNRKLLE